MRAVHARLCVCVGVRAWCGTICAFPHLLPFSDDVLGFKTLPACLPLPGEFVRVHHCVICKCNHSQPELIPTDGQCCALVLGEKDNLSLSFSFSLLLLSRSGLFYLAAHFRLEMRSSAVFTFSPKGTLSEVDRITRNLKTSAVHSFALCRFACTP